MKKEMDMKKKVVLIFVTAVFFTTGFVTWSNLVGANDLTPMEELGKHLFFDKIASPDNMSCATCHAPSTGFTGPIAGINKFGAVYRGAVPQRFGNRKPPSAAYATLSPVFDYDDTEGLFVGGNFWDGRATGWKLGNPAADQALGPFLNPVEQNNPSKQAVCEQVANSKYAYLFEIVFNSPINCETVEAVNENYNNIGLAIAAYEGSSEVNQFSSKYDLFLAGEVQLTEQEAWGLELFEGDKAMCSACHPTGSAALFTDFTYDNLGVPKNPDNPFYNMDKVYLDDNTPINPLGPNWIDIGLAGFLQTLTDSDYSLWGFTDAEWPSVVAENMGKQKVPTLRNVAKAPGKKFPKAYLHNGYLKTLKQVVHFYNTRDVKEKCPDPLTRAADAIAQNCWPAPEVADNVNTDELGDLQLTEAEEDAIVSFMETLSDGYRPRP
jgi:cytochrome c peroxidase